MKNILLMGVILMGLCATMQAQDYFIKGINIDQTSSDTGLRIIADETGYTIACGSLFFGNTLGGMGIVRTDLQGNKVWENAFNDSPNESGIGNFSRLADGNYMITGGTYQPGLSWQDTFVKVSSSDGSHLHTTYFGDSLRNTVPFSTLDNYGNHIAFSTYGIVMQYSHNILLKLDTAGQVIHSYPLADIPGYNYQYSEEMIVLPNGEYVLAIATETDTTDWRAFIRKTDSIGTTIWEQPLNDYEVHGGAKAALLLLQDGNFVTNWGEPPNPNTEPWASNFIRCYNPEGGQEWQYTFWSTDYVRNIQGLSLCANGDIICCGHTTNFSITGTFTTWIGRLSPLGELRWIREYVWWDSSSDLMFLYDLDEDPYGDIVATGIAALPNNLGIIDEHAVLLKVNSEGCLSPDCNDSIIVRSIVTGIESPTPPPRTHSNNEYRPFAVLYDSAAARLHLIAADLGVVGTAVGHFALYDLSGKVVANQPLVRHQASYQIDLSALPSGIYVYAFTDRLGAVVQRGKVAVLR